MEHLEVGMKLHAKYWDGQFYAAEVVTISDSSRRAKAPVKIKYRDFTQDAEQWCGLADLKSKKLPKAGATPKAEQVKEKGKAKQEAGNTIPEVHRHQNEPTRSKSDYTHHHHHHHGDAHGLGMPINSFPDRKVKHWGYLSGTPTGPVNWGCLCKEYALAKDGKEQSPIDLFDHVSVSADAKLSALEFSYTAGPGMLENNGHSCQLNFSNAGSACIEGNSYDLKQVHFHSPSEHTVNGRLYPLEMHMVHVGENGKLAVIGLLFEHGDENPFLKQFWGELTAEVGNKQELPGPFDLGLLNLDSAHYFRYNGSLTTPPCTEGVLWTVTRTVYEASPEQVHKFRELMDFKFQRWGNNRPVQPLNSRLCATYK